MQEKDLNTIVGAPSGAPAIYSVKVPVVECLLEKFGKDMDFWVIRSGQRLNKQKTLISVLGK